jgi:hypothetical protein
MTNTIDLLKRANWCIQLAKGLSSTVDMNVEDLSKDIEEYLRFRENHTEVRALLDEAGAFLSNHHFFDRDDSGHWYMIPVDKRELWDELNNQDSEEEGWYERWQEAGFDDYSTGGGISNIEFIPIKTD